MQRRRYFQTLLFANNDHFAVIAKYMAANGLAKQGDTASFAIALT